MLLDQRTIVSADLFWVSPHHRQRTVEDDADLAGWLRCPSRPLQQKLGIRFHQPASCAITLGLLLLPVPLLLVMLLLLLLELSVLLRCCLPSPPYSLAPRRQLCCSARECLHFCNSRASGHVLSASTYKSLVRWPRPRLVSSAAFTDCSLVT